MKGLILFTLFVAAGVSQAFGQARPADKDTAPATVRSAPQSFEARYEGGMFGFSKKEAGTLRFDDLNERIVFFGKDRKEKFSLPYSALTVIYPDSRSVTSTTGQVVRNIPLPGAGLAGLITEKRRYLIIQFVDPVVDARGAVSFKLEDKELLASVIYSLGEKAEMTRRGDAYYRPRNVKPAI
jgi:hypothetical protein